MLNVEMKKSGTPVPARESVEGSGGVRADGAGACRCARPLSGEEPRDPPCPLVAPARWEPEPPQAPCPERLGAWGCWAWTSGAEGAPEELVVWVVVSLVVASAEPEGAWPDWAPSPEDGCGAPEVVVVDALAPVPGPSGGTVDEVVVIETAPSSADAPTAPSSSKEDAARIARMRMLRLRFTLDQPPSR